MKTVLVVLVLLVAVNAYAEGGYLFGCAGKSCIELLNGSGGGGGGSYGQSVASGGDNLRITVKVTENEVEPEDDLYYINKKSVKFSRDVKFSGRRKKSSKKRRNAEMDAEMGNRGSVIIKGEVDTQGRSYRPGGAGNLKRSDGTFMQKTGGGYIDSSSGEFVPVN